MKDADGRSSGDGQLCYAVPRPRVASEFERSFTLLRTRINTCHVRRIYIVIFNARP